MPGERFEERVTAVVVPRPGQTIDEAELAAFTRQTLAGYKIQRCSIVIDHVQPAANGKTDYKWAKDVVLQDAASHER